jgi:hypothetical protein
MYLMEPQINADECRFVDRDFQPLSKDDKTQSSDPKRLVCESASSAQSVLYRTDSRIKSTAKVVEEYD